MTAAPPAARHRDLSTALAGLALVLLWEAAGLDLAVMRHYGSAAGFPWRDAWWASEALHRGGRMLAGLVLAGVAVDALRARATAPSRAERSRCVAVVVAAMLLVPAIKQHSLTSCPWDLREFGGSAVYVPHARIGQADGGPGRCFPSGHAVGGFAFLACHFLWRRSRPRLARAWLLGALGFGLLFGWTQVARGAHYPSHVLWTAWLCWALAAAADAAAGSRLIGVRPI